MRRISGSIVAKGKVLPEVEVSDRQRLADALEEVRKVNAKAIHLVRIKNELKTQRIALEEKKNQRTDTSKPYKVNRPRFRALKWVSGKSNGCLDFVNGAAWPIANKISVGTTLRCKGWAFLKKKSGIELADSIELRRSTVCIAGTLQRTRRGDLAKHFGIPELMDAGFDAYFSSPSLVGDFELVIRFPNGKELSLARLQLNSAT